MWNCFNHDFVVKVCLLNGTIYWVLTRQALYIKHNIEMCSCNHYFNGKVLSITHPGCVCICSLSNPVCDVHAPYYLWPALLDTIFPQFSEKKLLSAKCVFWFSIQILSETFLILRRNEWDMIKMYIGLHVKYPLFLSILMTLESSWHFQKILKHQISWKSVRWEQNCFVQTDRHDEANSRFSQFCECA
jgi:hypothetical protein